MDNVRAISQLYVLFWSLLNITIIIAVIVLVFRYFKQNKEFKAPTIIYQALQLTK